MVRAGSVNIPTPMYVRRRKTTDPSSNPIIYTETFGLYTRETGNAVQVELVYTEVSVNLVKANIKIHMYADDTQPFGYYGKSNIGIMGDNSIPPKWAGHVKPAFWRYVVGNAMYQLPQEPYIWPWIEGDLSGNAITPKLTEVWDNVNLYYSLHEGDTVNSIQNFLGTFTYWYTATKPRTVAGNPRPITSKIAGTQDIVFDLTYPLENGIPKLNNVSDIEINNLSVTGGLHIV